jgi:sec-independent protein translocase protein TatA
MRRMPNIGPMEIVGLLLLALLLFGAKRLPEVGQSLGQGIREFKKSFGEIQRDAETPRAEPPGSVSALRSRAGDVEPERREPKRLIP